MMPVWFRPWMAWAAAVAALLVLLGVQTLRLADAQTDLANDQAAHAKALAKATEEARKTETALRSDLDDVQAAAAKEKEIAKSREDALVESVRDGSRRLSVRAVCPGGTGLRAPAAGSGWSDNERAELDGQTSERILSIVLDGDRYIRERNACVAAYEAVRKRLNAASQ